MPHSHACMHVHALEDTMPEGMQNLTHLEPQIELVVEEQVTHLQYSAVWRKQ